MRMLRVVVVILLLYPACINGEQNQLLGTYFHQGECLADKAQKTAVRIFKEQRFKASFWTCDTMLQISGRYEIRGDRIIFIFDPPSEHKIIFRRMGRRLIPIDREKTFYGCGIREECLPEKDYYLKID